MSSWIPKFTAETTVAEIVEHRSALNPHPERVQGDSFFVSEDYQMPTPDSNHHLYIDYGDGQHVRARFPVRPMLPEQVTEPEHLSKNYLQQWPDLGNMAQSGEQPVFVPIAAYFDIEASHLASSHLERLDRVAAMRARQDALDTRDNQPVAVHTKFVLDTFETALDTGALGVAQVMPQALFDISHNGHGSRGMPTPGNDHVTKQILPALLEPKLRESPYSLHPGISTSEVVGTHVISDRIGRHAAQVLKLGLERKVASQAAEQIGHPEVQRKMALLGAHLLRLQEYNLRGLQQADNQLPAFARGDREVDLQAIGADGLVGHLVKQLRDLQTTLPQRYR